MDAKTIAHRWYYPTPGWLVYGAVVATGVLAASERWRWFPFNEHKGYTVLMAVAALGSLLIMLYVWQFAAVLFRKPVRFGPRTCLVFVALCGLVYSWVVVRLRGARRQAVAVAAIQAKPGSQVAYDWQFFFAGDSPHVAAPEKADLPSFLSIFLGTDFFNDVEFVALKDDQVTGAALAGIADLAHLKSLRLDAETVTDADLSRLEGLTDLRHLELDHTKVTDEGVNKLRRLLPNCEIDVHRGSGE